MAERRKQIRSNVLAYLALFLALTGGVASASHPGGANTINSADVIDGEVKTADLATSAVTQTTIATNSINGNKIIDGQVSAADLGNQSVATAELANDAVTNNKLANGAVNSNKITNAAILGLDVANNTLTGTQVDEATLFNDNSLTGADIDESTLSAVPSTPTGPAGGDLDGTYPDPVIADAAVTIPKLDFDPATQAELDQLATDDGDPPNAGSNQLNWNRLVGVPGDIADGDAVGWELDGNSGTTPSHFLGTTDNQPLNVRVNDARALRLEPASDGTNPSPNVIGGSPDNSVSAGVHSATIGGGGRRDPSEPASANRVTDDQGTVGGGAENRAGNGGGPSDVPGATVAGGVRNLAGDVATTVGGGIFNTASGQWATVGGGQSNLASGHWSTVPGGVENTAQGLLSFAAGSSAKANHDGAFVWADSFDLDFPSTAPNQFNVRSTGGARIVSGIDGSGNTTSGLELPANTSGWSTLVNGSPFDIRVNNARALRIGPASDGTNQSPNVIGGIADNAVTAGVHSATIGGGGRGTVGDEATANRVTDNQGTVGGGADNQAGGGAASVSDRPLATVGGGASNEATGDAATVGGGRVNIAAGAQATVGGGNDNIANGDRATIGGGISNRAPQLRATVGGGQANQAAGIDATVGGGINGLASGQAATVPGGSGNEARGAFSLAAGRLARAPAPHNGAFVWADSNNLTFASTAANQFNVRATGGTRLVSGIDPLGNPDSGVELPADTSGLSTIGTGDPFDVTVNGSRGLRIAPASDGTSQSPNVIGGTGDNSVTPGVHSATLAGGGRSNPSDPATANEVTDDYSTVGGGANNQAGDGAGPGGRSATVAGGVSNTASGIAATVPGGAENTAQGTWSLAAGRKAMATHDGAFVWADSNGITFGSTGLNQFSVRSTGGARFVSAIDPTTGAPTAGVELAPGGGSWSSLSDAASKREVEPVHGREVLRKLAEVPISTWGYRSQDESIRHIGPMAQDFYRAFGVGENRRHIASVDADGVALAAIKGLHRKLQAEHRRRHEQERRLDRLEARLAALERGAR